MPPSRPRRLHRRLPVLSAALLAVSLWAGCSGDDKPSTPATSASSSTSSTPPTTEAGTEPTPKASAEEAVVALLRAEERGDHAASYRLLSPAARTEIGDRDDWTERRTEVPIVRAFTIDEVRAPGTVVALVEHEPGLDPFIGLSPARSRQIWTAARGAGGWLVEAEPGFAFLLPPDAAVPDAVLAWATAVQDCDQAEATSLQAVEEIFGLSEGAAALCGSTGEISLGPVGPLAEGPDSAELVAQYSVEVLSWARVVPVTGPTPRFSVVVAPIGNQWRVLAVSD